MKVILEQNVSEVKRRRGAGRKIIVLGLLKRQGKVFTSIIPRVPIFILTAGVAMTLW